MSQRIRFCTTTDGVRIAYAVIGQGPIVVYVSGAPAHLEREWSEPAVRDLLTRLARRCTLVRYDMRGSGLSDRDVDDFSLERLRRDLDAVVGRLPERPIRLLSLGALAGPLALTYAADHLGAVERIALYGGYVNGADLMAAEDRQQLIDYTSRFGFPQFAFTDMDKLDLQMHRSVDEVLTAAAGTDVFAAVLETYFSVDLTSTLSRVSVPCLVLHGTEHRIAPLECGRRLAAMLPDAQFQPIPGGTSSPFSVADELVPAVERFFGLGVARSRGGGSLTDREREILGLLGRAMSNAEIAAFLHISEKTVKAHVGHILSKLGARDRTEAAILAATEQLGS